MAIKIVIERQLEFEERFQFLKRSETNGKEKIPFTIFVDFEKFNLLMNNDQLSFLFQLGRHLGMIFNETTRALSGNDSTSDVPETFRVIIENNEKQNQLILPQSPKNEV